MSDLGRAWYEAYVEASIAIKLRQSLRPPRLWEYVKRPRLLQEAPCSEVYDLPCHSQHAGFLRLIVSASIIALLFIAFVVGTVLQVSKDILLVPILFSAAWYLVLSPYFTDRAAWHAHQEGILSRQSEKDKLERCIAALVAYLDDLKLVRSVYLEFGLERVEWMEQSSFWLRLRDKLQASTEEDDVLRDVLVGMDEDCRLLEERAGEIENLLDGLFQMATQCITAMVGDLAAGRGAVADAVAGREDLMLGVRTIGEELLAALNPPEDWEAPSTDGGAEDDADTDTADVGTGVRSQGTARWLSVVVRYALRQDQFRRLTADDDMAKVLLKRMIEALEHTDQLLRSHAS